MNTIKHYLGMAYWLVETIVCWFLIGMVFLLPMLYVMVAFTTDGCYDC